MPPPRCRASPDFQEIRHVVHPCGSSQSAPISRDLALSSHFALYVSACYANTAPQHCASGGCIQVTSNCVAYLGQNGKLTPGMYLQVQVEGWDIRSDIYPACTVLGIGIGVDVSDIIPCMATQEPSALRNWESRHFERGPELNRLGLANANLGATCRLQTLITALQLAKQDGSDHVIFRLLTCCCMQTP